MKIEFVSRKGMLAEVLGQTPERAQLFDELMAKLLKIKDINMLTIIERVGEELDPDQNEWFAFFYGWGMYCGRKGIF